MILPPNSLTAQAPSPPAEKLQAAAALFAQGDWAATLTAYEAIAAGFPTHALARFRIGVSLTELGRLSEGETSLREGERLGVAAPNVAYRLAQNLAEQRKADAAIAELMRAAAGRAPVTVASIANDPHFATLKSHAGWGAVLDAFDAVARPCMHDPRHREFDFWIGDWDVRPTGAPAVGPAARNTVTLENNGCDVVEHWVAPGGSEGQSFNLYDRSRNEWRQTWVDNSGGEHDYHGHLVNGNMIFEGDTPAPGGALGRTPTRLTFFHVSRDSVRQFSEQSTDGGKTWSTAYDLMYVRRREPEAARPAAVPLSDADRAAILALDSTFVRGWLKDDTTAVLGVFAADAVLVPPGATPVEGIAAIRAFWWPNDGSHTRITDFRRDVVELTGTKGFAVMRANSSLSWSSTKAGAAPAAQTSRSTELVVLRQDASGQWRVARQVWTQLP